MKRNTTLQVHLLHKVFCSKLKLESNPKFSVRNDTIFVILAHCGSSTNHYLFTHLFAEAETAPEQYICTKGIYDGYIIRPYKFSSITSLQYL